MRKETCPARRLFASTERVDIDRQRLDRGGIEPADPGGHDAGAAVADGLDERRLVRTVEPDLVGQVGRAEFLVTLGVIAVARRAVISEDFLARSRVISRSGRQAG